MLPVLKCVCVCLLGRVDRLYLLVQIRLLLVSGVMNARVCCSWTVSACICEQLTQIQFKTPLTAREDNRCAVLAAPLQVVPPTLEPRCKEHQVNSNKRLQRTTWKLSNELTNGSSSSQGISADRRRLLKGGGRKPAAQATYSPKLQI